MTFGGLCRVERVVVRVLFEGSTGSNDKLILVWDLNGDLTTDSELVKPLRLSFSGLGTIPELQLMQNAESNDNEVKLVEKIDDISEGAINCCSFSNNGVLATGSGFVSHT